MSYKLLATVTCDDCGEALVAAQVPEPIKRTQWLHNVLEDLEDQMEAGKWASDAANHFSQITTQKHYCAVCAKKLKK